MSGLTINLTPNAAPAAPASQALHVSSVTSYDLVERLVDYLGADPGENAYRQARRAIQDALREFAVAHRWTYYQAQTRLALQGQYTLGTVQYQYSSGAYPRQLTLTPDPVLGGAFPPWAARGYVRVNNIVAKVARYVSPTVLVLQDPLAYPDDVAAGASYSLYQDSYTLPADFAQGENSLAETVWGQMNYIQPAQWLELTRYQDSYGIPAWYTVMGDPNVQGALCLKIFPHPDTDGTLDLLYQRRPRAVTTFDLSQGTATVDANAAPSTVNLSQPLLTPAMVGAAIRLSATTAVPTGLDGLTPYAYEGYVTQVTNASQCQVDTPVPFSYRNVGYRVSDPIDLEDLAMATAFSRLCEKHVSKSRVMDPKVQPLIDMAYKEALISAKEADARVQARRSVGVGGHYRPRLAFMPRGPDIS